MDPSTFVGRAPEQVVEFLEAEVQPLLDRYGFAKKIQKSKQMRVICRYAGQLEGSVSLAV